MITSENYCSTNNLLKAIYVWGFVIALTLVVNLWYLLFSHRGLLPLIRDKIKCIVYWCKCKFINSQFYQKRELREWKQKKINRSKYGSKVYK